MTSPASELGKLSWKKRKKQYKTREHMAAIGALGAAKTNIIKAAKRAALDKSDIHTRNA